MITNFSTSSIRSGVKRKRFWDQSAVANSFFSIATVTVGSSGQANIEFTNIPQTYTHLQIRGIAATTLSTSGSDSAYIQLNSDTGSNYASHYLSGNGSAASSSSSTSASQMNLIGNNIIVRATSNTFGVCIIDILDYANTNKFKTLRSIGGNDRNGAGEVGLNSGLWRSTNAITSIKIYNEAARNFAQYSSFALYGVLA